MSSEDIIWTIDELQNPQNYVLDVDYLLLVKHLQNPYPTTSPEYKRLRTKRLLLVEGTISPLARAYASKKKSIKSK